MKPIALRIASSFGNDGTLPGKDLVGVGAPKAGLFGDLTDAAMGVGHIAHGDEKQREIAFGKGRF